MHECARERKPNNRYSDPVIFFAILRKIVEITVRFLIVCRWCMIQVISTAPITVRFFPARFAS